MMTGIAILLKMSWAQANCEYKLQDLFPPINLEGVNHALYARCHPNMPYGFSNEFDDTFTSPAILDMQKGTRRRIPIQATDKGRTLLIDAVPSPSGRYVYTHLLRGDERGLSVFKFENGEMRPHFEHISKPNSTDVFDYPSPASRNGEEYILFRGENQVRIAAVDIENKSVRQARTLCGNILKSAMVQMPYISGDGRYLGVDVDNRGRILEIDWDKATTEEIPCRVIQSLPFGSGKMSFSADNTRVAFHTTTLDGLGRSEKVDGRMNSFVMEIRSGKVMPLANTSKDQSSEFPSFCGNDGILTRTNSGLEQKVEFRVLKAPSVAEITSWADGDCRQHPADRGRGLGK